MNADKFLSDEERSRILSAIGDAENQTSGEIRLHIENYCPGEVLDRASHVFASLGMHKTAERNGVLFFLAIKHRKLAILGDSGINQKVPADFWDSVRDAVLTEFATEQFASGLEKGIRMAGEKLKLYFPRQDNDINELSNEISFE